jgi:hypothetical protein
MLKMIKKTKQPIKKYFIDVISSIPTNFDGIMYSFEAEND